LLLVGDLFEQFEVFENCLLKAKIKEKIKNMADERRSQPTAEVYNFALIT
jgi:hypothetical protein